MRWLLVGLVAVGLATAQEPTAPLREFFPTATFDTDLGSWERAYGSPRISPVEPAVGTGSLEIAGPGGVRTPLLPYRGEFLRFAWQMRTADVVHGEQPYHRCVAQVTWFDAEGKRIRHSDPGRAVGTTPWTEHQTTIHFEDKDEVAFVQFALLMWNCTGTGWFDEVRIEVMPPPELYRRVPPLAEVEAKSPVRWPLPPLGPLVEQIDTGRLAASFAPDASWRVTAAAGGPSVAMSAGLPLPAGWRHELGTDLDRGYLTRQRFRGWRPADQEPYFEAFVELFRGSPLVSVFLRIWLDEGDTTGFGYAFDLTGEFDQMIWFDGNQPRRGAPSEVTYTPGTTTKPFVVYHDAADSAGVLVYLPHRPEFREWFIEDYLVRATPLVTVTPERTATGLQLALAVPAQTAPTARGWRFSLDCPVMLLPYRGPAAAALAELALRGNDLLTATAPLSSAEADGYWTARMSNADGARALRMARYFPTEFTSWLDAGHRSMSYGHRGGFAWGDSNVTMKGIRLNPLSEKALERDHAFRLLTFFVTAGSAMGAPPAIATYRPYAANLPDPAVALTRVFCQMWEWRINEYRQLLASPHLTGDEKQQLWTDLQAARRVYDPDSPATWSEPTPGDGLWFRYLSIPAWPENQWVINTHATSVGNVGELALLAREIGDAAGEAYWADLFRRGVAGLLHATGQDWMWYVDDHDPNELRYGVKRGGPQGYHRYMITAWVPRIMDLAVTLQPSALPDLIALQERMLLARFIAGDEEVHRLGQAAIERARAAAANP